MTVNLEALYLEHEPRVRWVMRARGVPEASVDDLVHESFVAIHRRLPQRDRSVPLATWITGVARNVAFSHRRTEARRRRHLRALPDPAPAATPDEVVAEREAWRAVEGFATTLTPKLREVFLLAEVGGVSVAEVARITGVPVPTLHSRLRLARARFVRHFESARDEPARRTLLATAAKEQASTPAARRRSMAALVATVGARPSAATSLALGAKSVLASVAIAAVAVVAVAKSAGSNATTNATTTRTTTRTVARPSPATVTSDPPVLRREPGHLADPVSPVRADPKPDPADDTPAPAARVRAPPPADFRPINTTTGAAPDPLAVHVDALARARAALRRPSETLAILDAVSDRHPALARDHQRLVLQAACAADEQSRAKRAARALRGLGLSADTNAPCAPNIGGEAK